MLFTSYLFIDLNTNLKILTNIFSGLLQESFSFDHGILSN